MYAIDLYIVLLHWTIACGAGPADGRSIGSYASKANVWWFGNVDAENVDEIRNRLPERLPRPMEKPNVKQEDVLISEILANRAMPRCCPHGQDNICSHSHDGRSISDLPKQGSGSQDHFEVLRQKDIGTNIERKAVASGRHLKSKVPRINKQHGCNDANIEGPVKVGRWAKEPPEAKYAKDERGGQDRWLP